MESVPITAITGFIARRFNLDTTTTLLLSQIIGWIFTLNYTEWSFELPTFPWQIIGIFFIPGVIYFGYRIWIEYRWVTLTVYDLHLISQINDCISEIPEIIRVTSQSFGSPHQIKTGSASSIKIPNTWSQLKVDRYNCEIKLNYIQRPIIIDITNGQITNQKETREYIPVVSIRVKNLDISPTEFTNLFGKILIEKRSNQRTIILHGLQIGSIEKGEIDWIKTQIYKARKNNHIPDKIISSYFYKYRMQLIQSIKTAMDRHENWNAILYGPPGSGKSHLITTLAKYFGRDIISIDLRLVNRTQLMKILTKFYKTAIIVFDEFDYAIAHLVEKEKRHKNHATIVANINNQSVVIEDKPDLKDLRLHDLLGIFQGPIPYPDMIIIATTNDLEYIRQQSEALIRPGRLTPWHIDYIETEVLHQIIRHYFRDINPDLESNRLILPDQHSIPTSLILEYAKSSLGDYNRFCTLLSAKINS
jgi:hypothetical protein